MRTSVIAASVLLPLLPVLLGSCATLGSVLSQDPKVDSAGPLEVGKTWTVSGVIDGGTVSNTFEIGALYSVPGGSGTVAERDRLAALEANQAGFKNVSYIDSVSNINASGPNNTLSFVWLGTASETTAAGTDIGKAVPRYTCTISTLLSAPYSGVLTLQRNGNTYRGTCSASST